MKDETKRKPKLLDVRQVNVRLHGKMRVWLESLAASQDRAVADVARNIIRAAYEAATEEAA